MTSSQRLASDRFAWVVDTIADRDAYPGDPTVWFLVQALPSTGDGLVLIDQGPFNTREHMGSFRCLWSQLTTPTPIPREGDQPWVYGLSADMLTAAADMMDEVVREVDAPHENYHAMRRMAERAIPEHVMLLFAVFNARELATLVLGNAPEAMRVRS